MAAVLKWTSQPPPQQPRTPTNTLPIHPQNPTITSTRMHRPAPPRVPPAMPTRNEVLLAIHVMPQPWQIATNQWKEPRKSPKNTHAPTGPSPMNHPSPTNTSKSNKTKNVMVKNQLQILKEPKRKEISHLIISASVWI